MDTATVWAAERSRPRRSLVTIFLSPFIFQMTAHSVRTTGHVFMSSWPPERRVRGWSTDTTPNRASILSFTVIADATRDSRRYPTRRRRLLSLFVVRRVKVGVAGALLLLQRRSELKLVSSVLGDSLVFDS